MYTMRLHKTLILIGMLLCIFSNSSFVFADEQENTDFGDMQQQFDELLEQSGANELFDIVPPDAKELMEKNNIKSIDTQSLLNINFFDFLTSIFSTIKTSLARPLSILLSSIGVILLCALINSLKAGFENSSYERVFSVVSVMCIASAVIMPIAQIFTKASATISQASRFILSFIPVYVGIITASGKPISAAAYSTSLIGMVQVMSYITAIVLVPLLSIYLAFCLIGATSVNINVEGIARGVKNTVITVLGFLLTLFIGLLSIQGVVANAGDSLSLKATKFAVSAFLPVVGSAISEALSSVQGCMGVIRSSVGVFGIITLVAAFLPSIISVLLMQLALSISAAISDMLDTGRITSVMRATASVLSLLLGILLLFFVMMVISITIMLTMTNGG